MPSDNPDLQRRFGGVQRVYGAAAMAQFAQSHVCVVGLGGVGSWAVEALARSGIGQLTLIDMDHVAESNINRQLHATSATLGQAKSQALRERVHSINPSCVLEEIDDFITPENVTMHIQPSYDWVIDCIDNARAKAALIAHCGRQKQRIITVGGAGGMSDPTRIQTGDLARSREDPLLSKTRKLLRQNYRFPSNPARRFDVPCIWSEEPLRYMDATGDISNRRPEPAATPALSCAGGLGSAVVVTSSFGFFAAAHVLKKIAAQAKR